jgi:anti-sigma factor (TIGR02949 family)
MSCDCGEALGRLSEFIDGEVGPVDQGKLAEHLAECGPCLQEFDVARIVKSVVARSCWEQAPAELKARVLAQIDAARGKGQSG